MVACGLDGALRAHMNPAHDSRLGRGLRRLVATTGEHQDPGGKGDVRTPRMWMRRRKGAPQFRVPHIGLRPSTRMRFAIRLHCRSSSDRQLPGSGPQRSKQPV